MTSPPRATPFVTQMRRGRLPASSCRHPQVDGHHRQSGRNAFPKRDHPTSNIMSPIRNQPGSWTKIRLGARARNKQKTTRFPTTGNGRGEGRKRRYQHRLQQLGRPRLHRFRLGRLDRAGLHR
jgi:hypothetical protein